ncbi:MAG: CooT family nickel-binding protein [Spirochaetaceae bacterium]|jgi:predicted RNA-binding protein|nr:CooT family nickel-binding protein [Spirochaetaceae bacterium]
MCLSTAYELGAGDERKQICEYVSNIKVSGDTITLTDLMGIEINVSGILEGVDLVKNAILIRPFPVKGAVKRYEMIREIFNNCSGNQMRDVDVQEIETDDVDGYLARLYRGEHFTSARSVSEKGVVVFDIDTSGIAQRVSFTEID